jgi:hypothetical protein
MTPQTRTRIGWVLTGLLGLMLLGSAAYKLSGSAEALAKAAAFGLLPTTYRTLGLLEAASVLLFLWPRTAVPGTLLLAAYLGGAIATHLQHQPEGILLPIGLEAAVWLAAGLRLPELTERLRARRPTGAA